VAVSDVASAGGAANTRLLAPLTVAILLAVGIGSFVAMLVLGAYAPDMGGRGRPGGHALSPSVTGFAGIVRLAEATGRHPRIVRNVQLLRTEDLVVATPESGQVNVDPVLGRRSGTPTLLVLPKWQTMPDEEHRGWVTIAGLRPLADPRATLAPGVDLDVVRGPSGGRPLRTVEPLMTGVSFRAPTPLQAIRPPTKASKGFGVLRPLVVDARGDIVVGQFGEAPLYVLADPDLLDNRGMRDSRTAASALAMLDFMNSNQAEGIAFDVTLNGIAHGASPLKLLFEPPFLAVTLTIAAALLLAALGTLARFGSPRPRARAIAFGKAALVDNTAALVRRAGAETRLGARYAEVIREAAARAFAMPARLRGPALDAALDRVAGRRGRFTTLADAVTRTERKDDMVGAARALHDWMGERV
jgi:hypothetical protein